MRVLHSTFSHRSFVGVSLALLGLIFGPLPALGLSQFGSRFWQIERGLPRNVVQAIAQTPDGFLWVGTQSGLARFDGEQFEFVTVSKTEEKSEWINTLCVARDGSLWVGTGGGGLFQFKNQQFIPQSLPKNADKLVLSLHETADGAMWCGTRVGLYRGFKGKFTSAGTTNVALLNPHRRITSQTIRSITEDAEGRLWMAIPGDLIEVRTDRSVTNHNFSKITTDLFLRSICCDRRGDIWIGTGAGLIRFSKGTFTHFVKGSGLPDNNVTAVFEDSRGNLWVGTYGGLCRFVNGKFIVETTHEGEPFDQISCFFEDREKNLWVGSKDGLSRLNQRQFQTYTTKNGLAHNNVVSVYEDSTTNLWIGTWGGGLHRLHDDQMTIYAMANQKALTTDLILGLMGGTNGLWFGTDYNGGLYFWEDGVVQRYGPAQGVPHNAIRALLEDRRGQLWIGMASGGVRMLNLKTRKISNYNLTKGFPSNAVRCFCERQDGTLWIGTEAGLVRAQGTNFTPFTKTNGMSSDKVFALYEDKEGTLWIGTDGGLLRFKDDKFTACTAKNGFFDDVILEILEDDFGAFWFASNRGVFRVQKQTVTDFLDGKRSGVDCVSFGKSDGMASSICVGIAKPSAWKSSDGRLWFATTKGLAVTDPKLRTEKNEVPPPVLIGKVVADKKPLSKNIKSSSGLRIPPGRGELEFHYTALSYRAPEQNRFKYKLEGIDPDWVEAGTRRVAYYNNLPPGDFLFRLQGSNNDGVWNESGESLRVIMMPHFWQTWSFKVFSALLIVAAVASSARYATKRRMQLKLHRLEQQHAVEKERARIAQDMHDEVGAKLTKITFLGGVAKNRIARPEEAGKEIDKILGTARDLIGSLDEIVWAVDPRNDTLDNFATYLCRHASEFFENSPVACQLEVPEEIPHHPLTADVRHNLFLALKETMNNALRHSGATKVCVQLLVRPDEFQIVISDNGRGFSQAVQPPAPDKKFSRKGNGLSNIRQRLESIGGKCQIESAEGKGTSFSFIVPLRTLQK